SLDRIADQVCENLLDLDRIDRRQRSIGVEVEMYADASRTGAVQRQSTRFVDHNSDALDLLLGLSAADEVTQSPDDLSRSHHLLSHLDHRFSSLAEPFWLAGRKQAPTSVRGIGGRRQRLIEFVSQGRRHLPRLA